MNESWAQLISAAVIGWVAWELRMLRGEVTQRIHYTECNRRMAEHAARIGDLEKQKPPPRSMRGG